MLHLYLGDAKFWGILFRIDQDLADEARAGGCPHCGGALHSARYPRKPRGVARSVLGASYEHRLSLCCAREGCRRRTTPPSVRFLGRRVFLSGVVVLVSALVHGLNTARREELYERFGVSARTVERWRRWWREVFAHTRFWRGARATFLPPLAPSELPGGLLERMGCGDRERELVATLVFLSPVTVP